jgi:hypothetical protein
VWDSKLFHIAFDLACEGAAAIARASGIGGYSSAAGFTSLELEQRKVVLNDARRIHAIIEARKGAA